jgi:histidinol-phosphate phosphatase family protein
MDSLKNIIDNKWTLFLDRDGVINEKLENDYVRDISQFKFLPDVLSAFKIFSQKFFKIIVVTNQQGVGKKLMTTEDVNMIHHFLIDQVSRNEGRIDEIFFAPYLKEENHIDRKPGIGMALKAKAKFHEIDFSKSIIVGDSKSDLEMGASVGMKTVFISQKNDKEINYDYRFSSLYEFAKSIL